MSLIPSYWECLEVILCNILLNWLLSIKGLLNFSTLKISKVLRLSLFSFSSTPPLQLAAFFLHTIYLILSSIVDLSRNNLYLNWNDWKQRILIACCNYKRTEMTSVLAVPSLGCDMYVYCWMLYMRNTYIYKHPV